jgi:murein DD-endopeptidase MepM/ murein hydrolase activator NlpD
MPPRPHPAVLASLAFGCVVVMALVLPHGAAGAVAWRWPLHGPVVAAFQLTPHAPFARGQRRGIDVSAAPGVVVRAACPGRVTFAGPLPRRGLAVSVRCGSLVATYLGLGRLGVRAGSRVARGERLGALGASGRLRLGARRAADRRGYVDPLTLLAEPGFAPPPRVAPAPRAPRARFHGPLPAPAPRAPHARFHRPLPAPAPALLPAPAPRGAPAAPAHRLPWPAYPAIALVASALPLGGLVQRRRRRRRARATAALAASRAR